MSSMYTSLFDVIGPVMVGPSSSHTSGAATIAWMARQIFSGTPVKATFTLYGSFADTYRGHGTDRALIGGILGYRSDDVRIRDSYKHAAENDLMVEFVEDHETHVSHPNTVDIVLKSTAGHTLLVRGESIGGGMVRIVRMNDITVEFTGEYSVMIIGHRNKSRTVAYITSCLADYNVNLATIRLFREKLGKDKYSSNAYTVIDIEGVISEELKSKLLEYEDVHSVDLIEI